MSRRFEEREAELRERLKDPSPCQITWLYECSSTMDEAKCSLSARGSEIPFAIFSERQLSGRGRNGASWEKGEGGLAGTFVLETFPNHASCLGLSLVVGVSIASTLRAFDREIQVKWPNDLLTSQGDKVGGILIELEDRNGEIVPYIGLGLNFGEAPALLEGVRGLQLEVPVAQVVFEMIVNLIRDLSRFKEEGFKAFQQQFLQSAAFLGEILSLESNGRDYRGQYCGVSEDGALLLRREDDDAPLKFFSAQNVRRV